MPEDSNTKSVSVLSQMLVEAMSREVQMRVRITDLEAQVALLQAQIDLRSPDAMVP